MTGLTAALGLARRFWWALPLLAFALWIAMLKAELRGAERRIAGLETRLAEARRDLGQCRANAAALTGAIRRQNAAIEAARRQGEARSEALGRLAGEARRATADAEARARRILARPAGPDPCAAASALIMESVR